MSSNVMQRKVGEEEAEEGFLFVEKSWLAKLPAPPAAGATSVQLQVTSKELKPYLQAGGTVNASISYSPTPVNARDLKLVLTIHGSLF